MKLVAIGGGGATHGTDCELDELVLNIAGRPDPATGFIGAASRDDDAKFARFVQRFPNATRLRGSESYEDASKWIDAQDILYVGGGNTALLIDYFRHSNLLAILHEAAGKGLVIAGVSAGAVCWFEVALSNSRGKGLEPLPSLGWLKGSCCPHFSSEPARRSVFGPMIAAGQLPDGIAIDDGAAVVLDDQNMPTAFSARPGHWAYRIHCQNGRAVQTALPAWNET